MSSAISPSCQTHALPVSLRHVAYFPDLGLLWKLCNSSPVLSGGEKGPHKVQGVGASFIPSVLDRGVIDEVLTVPNEKAFEFSQLLAKLEGIPGGISTGANLAAAITVAQRDSSAGKTVVTFAPSSAERYFSSDLFV